MKRGIGSTQRRLARARRLAGCGALLLGVWLVALPWAADAQRRAQRSYPVSAFVLEYPLPHPEHPPLAELRALEVEMRVTEGGLMQPHPTTRNLRFPLDRVPPETRIWASGLRHITNELLAEFERRGIGAVVVTLPDLEEGSGRDLRRGGERRLRIRIWTGRVERIATIADGDRFRGTPAERTNLPQHRFVREGVPVSVGGEDALVRIRELEDHARRLSRHPGRRVDLKLRPGEVPGTTRLEYHVAEQKPWLVYAQAANNGTDATGAARQRFGLSHNQLTGHDDVLRLDYVTGNFDDVHAGFASYEFPLWKLDRLRLRATGGYSEYDASEVGVARVDFSGDTLEAGGRVIAQLLQFGPFFVDAYGGASWRRIGVENELTLLDGEADEDFFLPEAGALLSYDGATTRGSLEAGVEWSLPDVVGSDSERLFELGRIDPSATFELLRWNGHLSFYLEPILYARRGFGDPGSPDRSRLANEVVLGTRGQWSFDDRLLPHFQQVVGGLYTVRGYEQSIVAGDSAAIASAEYRIHLAQVIDPGDAIDVPGIGPVRLRPQNVFARADWDLLLKAFLDYGRTYPVRSERAAVLGRIERREALAGWGLGVELQLLRNLRAGVDFAWPLRELSDGSRGSDNPQIHAVATVMF